MGKPRKKTYRSRSLKRGRRSRAEIEKIKEAIYQVARANKPATVRQIFYQLVGMGVIEKTEREYKGTVGRLLTVMRKSREMPFGWIADNSRWMRKPDSHDDLQTALEDSIVFYRRNLWRECEDYVEIWLEKEALSGVLYEVTSSWDVPLMVTRGYPSLSFLHEAAETISVVDKPAFLYYFGDRDPSGVDIPRNVEASIRDLAPDAELTFKCVAVTPSQIERWSLPTRPTKQTDSRAKNFRGDSVEVDAIEPKILRKLAEYSITSHIDSDALERNQMIEEAERTSGMEFIKSWNAALNA